jgi:hypothetical protein
MRQIGSCIHPGSIDTKGAVAQKIVGIEMKFLRIRPKGKYFLFGQFIAGLFIQEIAEHVLTSGKEKQGDKSG